MDGLPAHEQKRTALWAVLLPVDRGEGSLRGVMLLAEVQLAYGLALGFILLDGVEVLAYGLIGIDNNVGDDISLTFVYLILGAVSLILSIACAFFKFEKVQEN